MVFLEHEQVALVLAVLRAKFKGVHVIRGVWIKTGEYRGRNPFESFLIINFGTVAASTVTQWVLRGSALGKDESTAVRGWVDDSSRAKTRCHLADVL